MNAFIIKHIRFNFNLMTWSRIKIPNTMRIDSCPLDKMFFILKSYGFVSTIIIPDSIRPDLIPSRLAEKIRHASYRYKYLMFLFARRVRRSRATASGLQPTGRYDAYVFPVSILIYNPLQNRSCGKLRTLLRLLQRRQGYAGADTSDYVFSIGSVECPHPVESVSGYVIHRSSPTCMGGGYHLVFCDHTTG